MDVNENARMSPPNVFNYEPLPVLRLGTGTDQRVPVRPARDAAQRNQQITTALGGYGARSLIVPARTNWQHVAAAPGQLLTVVVQTPRAVATIFSTSWGWLRGLWSQEQREVNNAASQASRKIAVLRTLVKEYQSIDRPDVADVLEAKQRLDIRRAEYQDMPQAPELFKSAYLCLEIQLRKFTFDIFNQREQQREQEAARIAAGSRNLFQPHDARAPDLLPGLLLNPDVLKAPNFQETLISLKEIFTADVFPAPAFDEAEQRFQLMKPVFFPTPRRWQDKLVDTLLATGRSFGGSDSEVAELFKKMLQGLGRPEVSQTLFYMNLGGSRGGQDGTGSASGGNTPISPGLTEAIRQNLPIFGLFTAAFSVVGSLFTDGDSGLSKDTKKVKALFDSYRKEGAKQVQSFTKNLQEAINDLDNLININLVAAMRGDNNALTRAKGLLKRRQTLFMCVPTKPLWIGYPSEQNTTPHEQQRASEITRKENEFLQTFDKIPRLAESIRAIRINSSSRRPLELRNQLYLVGPSGTGKTYFAESLADVLGLPVIKLTLDFLDPSRTATLTDNMASLDDPKATDRKLLGPLAAALLEAGCQNPILFFDEVGRTIGDENANAFIRGQIIDSVNRIFDRHATTYKPENKDLNIEFEFTHPIIIFAGNASPSGAGLNERFDVINFPALSAQTKQRILAKVVNTWDSKVDASLSPAEITELKRAGEAVIPHILRSEAADPGIKPAMAKLARFRTELQSRVLHRQSLAEADLTALAERLL